MSDRMIIKPDGSWEFKGEDSRLKNFRDDHQVSARVWNPLAQKFEYHVMDKVYCMNCGKDGGSSSRFATYVRYFCDDCWPKFKGTGQFVPMPPAEEFAWRNGLPPPKEI